jgi:hypothetical protein
MITFIERRFVERLFLQLFAFIGGLVPLLYAVCEIESVLFVCVHQICRWGALMVHYLGATGHKILLTAATSSSSLFNVFMGTASCSHQ